MYLKFFIEDIQGLLKMRCCQRDPGRIQQTKRFAHKYGCTRNGTWVIFVCHCSFCKLRCVLKVNFLSGLHTILTANRGLSRMAVSRFTRYKMPSIKLFICSDKMALRGL